MPILVKTLQDLLNERQRRAQDVKNEALHRFKKHRVLPGEIQVYFNEYLFKKKLFRKHRRDMAKIFSDYKRRLGRGGF